MRISEATPTLNSTEQEPSHLRTRDTCRNEGHERETILRSALSQAGRGELKRIRVDVDGDTVRLRGRVTSYYLKQVAQEAIRPLAIGLRIDNRVQVHLN